MWKQHVICLVHFKYKGQVVLDHGSPLFGFELLLWAGGGGGGARC